MDSIHTIPAHLESFVSTVSGQPIALYVAVSIAVFLCCMVASEFDTMFS
jgi:hypothetical protein